MMGNTDTVVVAGAGLVGSLVSIYMAKRGYRVEVLEKRPDPRKSAKQEGRSINLALSHRGLKALRSADESLPEKILAEAIPMYGRALHNEQSQVSFQPYGDTSQCIYSVSRSRLNQILIDCAENYGVSFLFEHHLEDADFETKTLHLQKDRQPYTKSAPVLIAADGAFSNVRSSIERQGFCKSFIEKINHGYKELDVPPLAGQLIQEPNALHIWPRGAYMLIALPNFDGSLTGTLFLPFEGEDLSFHNLSNDRAIFDFFQTHFPDTLNLIPNLTEQFFKHPTSFLANVYTDVWAREEWVLIGDAAHAIVPFYGQGMNAGFEDCRLLNETLDIVDNNWAVAFKTWSEKRKPNTDAIAKLAMDNFIEMRDRVADQQFLLQKRIEASLSRALPNQWKTLYSEVTFSDTPYLEALQRGEKNNAIMQELMHILHLNENNWNDPITWNEILKRAQKK